jgi:hypothetical protein
MLQRAIVVSACCCVLGACAGAPLENGVTTAALSDKALNGLPRSDGWQPGERLFPEVQRGPGLSNLPAYRAGVTPSGMHYMIFGDGSGSVRETRDVLSDSWSFDCTRDAMTDLRNCKIYSDRKEIAVLYSASADPAHVCIRGHNFPGRTGAIRIDGGKPIITSKEGGVPGDVARRLAQAKQVAVRYVEWPYDYGKDASPTMTGLKETMDLVAFVYSHVDDLPFQEAG